MRIRSIKPEFWRSDDVDRLSWDSRLLYIGLWSYVDDNGVGRYALKSIVADLFAGDMYREPRETLARVSAAFGELLKTNLICAYVIGDTSYMYIQTWDNHQRVSHPNRPRFPRPYADNGEINDGVRMLSGESPDCLVLGTGEQGNRGTGEQRKLKNKQKNLRTKKIAHKDQFCAFWEIYPRKNDKKRAKLAWARAIKKTTPEKINAAAAAYRDDHNRKPEFTKLAATWLNGENWEDPPLPSAAVAVGRESRVSQWLQLETSKSGGNNGN